MNTTRFAAAVLTALAIAGCEGGGVDLNVSTTDNSTDNSTSGGNGGGSTNPCASYTPPNSNEVRIGTFDGTNCVYSAAFVSKTNPLLVDLTIPLIAGVHIFQDSLFVGQNVETRLAPASGAGPSLTIAAGNRLAFSTSADYVLINRGSQIFAEGSACGADHLHGVLRRRHEHGGRQRRVAVGWHRDQRQRHHEQLHRCAAGCQRLPCRRRGPAFGLRRERQRRQLGRAALRHRQALGLRGRRG